MSVANFLRMAVNARRDEPMKVKDFGKFMRENVELLKIDPEFVSRYLNEGFSGGEKKRAEILQLAMLRPEIAVLDETDSGLDIDALRIVSEGVNKLRGPEMGSLIITHYTRILNYVKPDFVHILLDGRIVREGGSELADELEEKGYDFIREEVAPPMPASWLEDKREDALKAFEAEEVPTWRRSGFWTTSLRGLDLDALEARHYEPLADGDALPAVVAEDIGDSELGGLIVQRGATTIRSWIDPEVEAQGVIVCSLEEAVEKHPDEVREWYGKRLDPSEGKFTAASLAFWTGGAFVWVPKDVKVEKPIQIVYLIDEPGTAQYAQTLAVVGEHSQVSIREYDLGTPFEGQALHAGGFELFARPGSRAEVAHFQDWGPAEVYDISTKRVEVAPRRVRVVGADPPGRPADQADAGHHHRRTGVGHAPHRHVLHRGRGAPGPVHHRSP